MTFAGEPSYAIWRLCKNSLQQEKTDNSVEVSLKSYCLPLLVYCIDALRMIRISIQHLSVCWNVVFRRLFHCKRFESVKCLQDAFGTNDINHMYDSHRWNFLKALHKR